MVKLTHFDFWANEPERAARFYEDLFGWKTQKFEEPAEYWMINIPGETENSGLDGGISRRDKPVEGVQPTSMLMYFTVDNVDNYSKKVKELGGQVLSDKIEVTGYGFILTCADTEGNQFAIWEDIK